MKKYFWTALPVATILLIGATFTSQQTNLESSNISGTWIAEFQEHKWNGVSESLWITMRANTRRDRHGFSFTIDLKDIDGLGVTPGHNGRSSVQFSLNREAGNFDFEGQFIDAAGSGTFAFGIIV